ncbi:MAG: hypothetical protein J2P15_09085, partial [Micromonosporaceae bacterium]|nr:hypothetical protein [Micromonosporaceae bacterium]
MEERAGMTSPKVDGKLTDLQLSTLIVLWTRPVGPVPNTDLTKVSINLDKKTRDKLAKATLIEVHQERENGPLSVKLTDAGRKRVDEYIDAELPSGTRCGAAALRAVLTVLRPLLNGKASAPPAVPVSATVDADMETRIRKAYATIARRPGARV